MKETPNRGIFPAVPHPVFPRHDEFAQPSRRSEPGRMVDGLLNWGCALSVELRREAVRGFLELAVNSQLNAADCQQVDPGFRRASFDSVADLELPFPDARHGCHGHRVFNALMRHGKSPQRFADAKIKHNLQVVSVQYCSSGPAQIRASGNPMRMRPAGLVPLNELLIPSVGSQ